MEQKTTHLFVTLMFHFRVTLSVTVFSYGSLANWSAKIGSEEATLNELKRGDAFNNVFETKSIEEDTSAFKMWSEYGHLKFVQAPTADADIVILFGHGYHGDR